MHFPKASEGLRLVFRSEIIELILTVIISICASIWKDNNTVQTITSICQIVTLLGCLIILIKGLQTASADEESYRMAYEITIGLFVAEIILDVLSLCVPTTFNRTSFFGTVLAMISNILICEGTLHLFARQGDMKSANFARVTTILMTITACLEAVAGVFVIIYQSQPTLGAILGLAALVLMLVSGVCYLILLNKGAKKFA